MKRLLLLTFLILGALQLSAQSLIQNLPSEWKCRKLGEQSWMPASVPGCIHTDLMRNGIIQDPYIGSNEQACAWVADSDWEYSTTFVADTALLACANISLVFEGIDTYADVFLNGVLVQHCDNMFRSWEIPCKSVIKKENELRIVFYSVTQTANKRYHALATPLPYDERVMVRKAPYQFGWDWGPKLVTMGIWKPARIIGWEKIRLTDFTYKQKNVEAHKASLEFSVALQSSSTSKVSIELYRDNILLAISKTKTTPGINTILIPYEIKDPKLWWPNGMGDPYLYHFSVRCKTENTRAEQASLNIGIRTIALLQDNDSIGQKFTFNINGKPLFIKGSNMIPPDAFPSRIADSTYRNLVDDAQQCHMNMLRVWGGGFYLHDTFYNLCDEKGIMVWQDFMFACALYPGDTDYLNNVAIECSQQVTRLRNHASLALWCGNNEIDEGWNNWGIQKHFAYTPEDSTRIWGDYVKLFHQLIPEILKDKDPARAYHPSSPLYGWGRKESMTHGDSHYWGIWWGDEPFEVFNKKVPRFMSEYGFQGFPDSVTLVSFGLPSTNIWESEALKNHEKHPRGFELISHAMQRNYREPSGFWDYATLSRTLQCDAMQIAIEAHRRSQPRCRGTLYWQFNDCWPVISWSGIAYNGSWKPAQYVVKRLYRNCILSAITENDSLRIYGVSDSLNKVQGQLIIRICSNQGTLLWSVKRDIIVNAQTSSPLYAMAMNDIKSKFDSTTSFLYAEIISEKSILASTTHLFCRPGNYVQPNPEITVTRAADSLRSSFTISSNVPVFKLWIESDQVSNLFSDNYLDLMPWTPLTISRKGNQTIPNSPLRLTYLNKTR